MPIFLIYFRQTCVQKDVDMPASREFEEGVLLEAAGEAAGRAYAPYSNYPVGAALATGSKRVLTACNVENASYGLTICAERAAVCKAISEGEREFKALAICAPRGAMPCGACLQVLDEFSPDLLVLLGDEQGNLTGKYHLRDLLPHRFSREALKAE